MTDLTHFERQEEEVGPFSSYEEKFAWACGYNTCLEQTNAKELYEALIRVKVLGAFHSDSEIGRIINAALSKATEKPQP